MSHLFCLDNASSEPGSEEFLEPMLRGSGTMRLERVISHGHASPDGFWHDQDEDEWVTVLEGEARLQYDDGKELTLSRGQHVLIPKRTRHRVAYASSPCIWLALFASELSAV